MKGEERRGERLGKREKKERESESKGRALIFYLFV
jgi:hypothetical protein